jgi:uncharacterized protein YecT (DUF1311 family)
MWERLIRIAPKLDSTSTPRSMTSKAQRAWLLYRDAFKRFAAPLHRR